MPRGIAGWKGRSEARLLVSFTAILFCQSGCGRIGFDALDSGVPDDSMGSDGAPSFARLCDFRAHVIIIDGITIDDTVGDRLSAAALAGCRSTATTRIVSQDDASEVDSNSGRPLVSANELIVLGGGDGPHRVVRYLLQADTPLVWGGSPFTITERATDRVIAQGATDSQNDYLLLQVVPEAVGGTISLSAQGNGANGTIAAALYLEKSIGQWVAAAQESWVVVRWTDSDGVPGPSSDDTFALIESG